MPSGEEWTLWTSGYIIAFHAEFVGGFFLFVFFLIFVSLHISTDIVSFKNANNLYTKCAINL